MKIFDILGKTFAITVLVALSAFHTSSEAAALVDLRGTGLAPLVLYTFNEGGGSTVRDISGYGTPMDLVIQNTANTHWLADGGLSVDKPTLIRSSGSANKIINAIKASNALTIEAWVQPTNTAQSGPARIVTLSVDHHNSNFTLGQNRNAYDVRLRTTGTNSDGLPSLASPASTLGTALTHVVYTRDSAGTARLYVNGVKQSQKTVAGNLSNWTGSYGFALANEFTGKRPWAGRYYQVAVYDHAISAADVNANYSIGPGSDTSSGGNAGNGGSNAAPTISGTSPTQIVAGNFYSFKPIANDADNDPLTFSISNRPSWASFNSSTGELSGTPAQSDAGSTPNITISVFDGTSTGSLPPFSLNANYSIGTGLVPLVLYTFNEGGGSTVRDTSGYGTPMDLVIQNTANTHWLADGGLSVDKPTLIRSSGSANKIINAIKASNALTIEAWVQPANTAQSGPARIVTLSVDHHNSNFTLGQNRNAYDVRLRTTSTNSDGLPSLASPAGTLGRTLTHVVYSRDSAGTARLYVNGVKQSQKTVAGNLSNWTGSYGFALANEFTGKRPWAGRYYQVAVYDHAISAADVNANYSIGPGSDTSSGGNAGNGGSDSAPTISEPPTQITSQTGSVSLGWTAPVARTDGSALAMSEITGFTVYYGASKGSYPDSLTIKNGSATSATIGNLPVGTYYLVVTTRDTGGRASGYSSMVTKQVP